MKKYVIYWGGKDLSTAPMTQNERGVYYYNGSTYHRPTLANFDTAQLPAGFKRYTNGSHAKYIGNALRNPLDFSITAGTPITANFDVKILSTSGVQAWVKCQIIGTDIELAFVHCYRFAPTNSIVKAGNQICQIAPTSSNGGVAVHLHIDIWTGQSVRKLILDGDVNMATFKVGDNVKFTAIQNIRSGAGDKFSLTRSAVVGETATIKDGPRTSQNSQFKLGTNDSYTWWDMVFDNGGTGWVADVKKFETYVQAPVIEPTPVDPQEGIDVLKQRVQVLESTTELQRLEIKTLNEELSETQVERDTMAHKYDVLYVERNRIENEKNEAVRRLKEMEDEDLGQLVGRLLRKLGLIQ